MIFSQLSSQEDKAHVCNHNGCCALLVEYFVFASNLGAINDFCMLDLKNKLMLMARHARAWWHKCGRFEFKGFQVATNTNNLLKTGLVVGFMGMNCLNTQGLV